MAAILDSHSVKKYTQEAESARQKFVSGEHVRNHMEGHVDREIKSRVDEKCSHRTMDFSSVTLAACTSAVVPFSGVAVMMTATVAQCIAFSSALGLIPIANLTSLSDLSNLSAQAAKTIQSAGGAGLHAGIEAAVFEILKLLGVDKWLWEEILKDILFEMVGECAFEAAWIVGPLFLSVKYKLHRKLSKKMYRKLGDKARKVHFQWVELNLLQHGQCTASTGYSCGTGYTTSNGYPANTGYPVSTGYSCRTGYPTSAGYPANTSYSTNNGYDYPTISGYTAGPGYPTSNGYTTSPGYPSSTGYTTAPGYPTTNGYTTSPGYPGYTASTDYPTIASYTTGTSTDYPTIASYTTSTGHSYGYS